MARRRVADEAVDDVIQDALRVVYEKGWAHGAPELSWCFQVLRNTIGNHYQKRRVRERDVPADAHRAPAEPTPLEALENNESASLIRDCLRTLRRTDAPCAERIERLLEGVSPAEIAVAEDVPAAVLYRRMYRCRAKLRVLLHAKGVLP